MYTDYIESPLGLVEFKASDKGITQLIFCGTQSIKTANNPITDLCKQQLIEYFSGKRKQFDVPLDPKGTDFQKLVWKHLSHIPFGKTLSYLDIAKLVNRPKGSQAVGGANGRNPISIIVPCHRVVGSNGALTGYAGGIERKLWLLAHEGIAIKHSKEVDALDLNNVINTRQAKTQFLK
ncbi:Methylated-DNA--protein-cysteine methyltransferase, constitutive [Pseudoalteromonas sp. CIP111854]|nr:methylated-DNA--[protein]-cysteine S-methyltransferase [Pseudoalteromonas sp. CIP111854]CAH9054758.1 Methylated-DNA--protein-cysteine methyltransferase, constitutive [Pseudoalteromonas sp. CIP111854]